MPAVYHDSAEAILRLGVAGPTTISMLMPFNLGAAGIIESDQPFSITGPLVGTSSSQPFNIAGLVGILSSQPFNLGAVAHVESAQPFNVIGSSLVLLQGTYQPPPALSVTVVATTPIAAGSNRIQVASTSGLSVGASVHVAGEPPMMVMITGITGLTLSVVPQLPVSYPAGTRIQKGAFNALLTAPAVNGASTITVDDTTGIVLNTILAITSTDGGVQFRAVRSVNGSILTLAASLGRGFATGSSVAQVGQFLPGMVIADKAGRILGAIYDYMVTAQRSYAIAEPGSMTFYVPRNSPDVSLIQSDRVVAMSNNLGMPLWVGTITTQEWSGSTGNIHCEDAYALLAGVPIEVEVEVADATRAWAIYKTVIDLVNKRRGADREMEWALAYSGSKPFLGDFSFSGDPDNALRTIADRSGTEYAWSGAIVDGFVRLTLDVADAFAPGTGVNLVDGDGGNVVSSPSYQVDPSTIINGLRLTGDQTDIKAYVDDWAEWAVYDTEPTIELYADTGDYRRRIDLDVNVDFSLSKKQQRALAQATQDDVWDMYERYVYAIHDLYGRPNHPSWTYEGPPAEIEKKLTKDKWHTHAELALFRDSRPAAIVMASSSSWLAVTYNYTWDLKSTKIYGKSSVYKPDIAHLTFKAGSHKIYEESGGYARLYTTYTNAAQETWTVDIGTITAKLSTGKKIKLRGIRTPAALRGRYINVNDSGYANFRPYSSVHNIDAAGSQIGHIWGIEKGQIRDWDPRRDGTGSYVSRKTVYNAKLTTRYRWHVVPFSTGEEAETQLDRGVFVVNATGTAGRNLADEIYVESCASFPINRLPFDIVVGDPLEGNQEIMRVWRAFGNRWTVWRGQSIRSVTTTASVAAGAITVPVTDGSPFTSSMKIIVGSESKIVNEVAGNIVTLSTPLAGAWASGTTVTTSGLVFTHQVGSLVRLLRGSPFEGFKYEGGYEWPEGLEYARNLLARLSRPSRLLTLRVANEADDWRSFAYGTTHTVDIQSEGPPGGVTGLVRCIGFSPSEEDGTMEVLVELVSGFVVP